MVEREDLVKDLNDLIRQRNEILAHPLLVKLGNINGAIHYLSDKIRMLDQEKVDKALEAKIAESENPKEGGGDKE